MDKPKYIVGQRVMFTKSMVEVTIIDVLVKHSIYGQMYAVEKDDGKQMLASQDGLKNSLET
jgi:hypothetical protein